MFSIALNRIFFTVLFTAAILTQQTHARKNSQEDQLPIRLRIPKDFGKASVGAGLECRCNQDFVEEKDLTVFKNLPDDKDGLPHQKFLVKRKNGSTLLVVSNLKLCERIPTTVGASVEAAGEYVWNKKGGLLHWTHKDPRRKRLDGWIKVNGKEYCK